MIMYLKIILSVFAAAFILTIAFWRIHFLRDPERDIPTGKILVSPADGRILKVIQFDRSKLKIKKGRFGKISTLASDISPDGWLISIFMSPFDVHVNRAPLDGKVISTRHSKGNFFNASHFEDSLTNEKNEMILDTAIGKIKVIQLAGFLARRIECFVKKGDRLKKGERYGLINLGSQVTLILPNKIRPIVKEGDRVKSGSSSIARY